MKYCQIYYDKDKEGEALICCQLMMFGKRFNKIIPLTQIEDEIFGWADQKGIGKDDLLARDLDRFMLEKTIGL